MAPPSLATSQTVDFRPEPAAENLLELFLQQLSWLTGGAQEAKRVFAQWLLASPPPPSGPAAMLSQARQLAGRHLVQLEQLLSDLALPVGPGMESRAIRAMLEEGDSCLQSSSPEPVRYAALLAVVQRISTCFGTACASAGETAIVLGRVDLAAVLASWAAAWRDLERSLARKGFSFAAAAYIGDRPEER